MDSMDAKTFLALASTTIALLYTLATLQTRVVCLERSLQDSDREKLLNEFKVQLERSSDRCDRHETRLDLLEHALDRCVKDLERSNRRREDEFDEFKASVMGGAKQLGRMEESPREKSRMREWTVEDTVTWIREALRGEEEGEVRVSVELLCKLVGEELIEFYEDGEHGLTFEDKLFFMGVPKRLAVILARNFEAKLNGKV